MPSGNPNHGQKVDLGKDAPVTQETAGVVPSESLAAESIDAGGEFAKNRDAHSENTSASQLEERSDGEKLSSATNAHSRGSDRLDSTYTSTSSSSSEARDTTSSSSEARGTGASTDNTQQSSSSAGVAPSYVENQFHRDTSGPHGKNITEGSADEFKQSDETDGMSKAMRAEPGSIDDPSREAERRFNMSQNTNVAAGGVEGPAQTELTNETKYDALSSNAPA